MCIFKDVGPKKYLEYPDPSMVLNINEDCKPWGKFTEGEILYCVSESQKNNILLGCENHTLLIIKMSLLQDNMSKLT